MKYILITLVLFQLTISAQHNFGVKANGGVSKIVEKFIPSNNLDLTFYYRPSYQAGLFYNYNFKKSLLGAELLFVQIEGKNYSETSTTDSYGNKNNDIIKSNGVQHISYLGIPIYYGLSFKKININFGFQLNLLMASSGKAHSETHVADSLIQYNSSSNSLFINKYDLGPRVGILYNFYKSFSLEANYYYGISNIHKNSPDWKWQVQQATIGLRYKIYTSNKSTEKD